MISRILTTPQADDDLVDIGRYLLQENPGVADKVVATIAGKYKLLARSPKLGRPREELALGLRSFLSEPYVVFYRIVPTGIPIIRVLHGARDIESEFE